jgi:ParB family chromosome partitioning protein
MRRSYPHPVDLSEEGAAAYGAAQEEYNRLSSEYEGYEELPDEADRRFAELEGEIERIDAKRHAYDADEIARGGVFVILNHDGSARIERGFIRAEDTAPEPEGTEDATVTEEGEIVGDEGNGEDAEPLPDDEETEDAGKPLSDLLIRDLTAHRTLGLRLALGEQPDMALVAIVHALAAQTFYRGGEASCLEIRLTSAYLASHADGIEDTPAAKELADRHTGWASDIPRGVADLWTFVAGLDHASLMALLAHCASLTVNAVRLPWEQKPNARATVEKLASAVTLDMTAHWTPTVQTYLGRVTKAHILAAVREAVSDEAAERIAGLKKPEMVQAAEQLLAGTGWLPTVLRTARPSSRDTGADAEAYVQAAE